jgi:hypothetical protein
MNRTVVEKLTDFRNAGAAWQKEQLGNRAQKALQDLRDCLKEDEWWLLSVAHSHYLTGEGRQEMDKVCNTLIQKYRHDPPERKRMLL